MTVLAQIEQGLRSLGYHAEAFHHGYSFADVLDAGTETRIVTLAAFTQTPESFRSAAFGVVQDEPDSSAAVMANRALGAPIFFSIDANDVGVWAVGARNAPRLLERVEVAKLPDLFDRYRERWTPQAMHRAKAIGSVHDAVQVDFIDLGLLPAIEKEVRVKLHQAMSDVLKILLQNDAGRDSEKAAFRLTFRLLAAKILIDCEHPAAFAWDRNNVDAVLTGIQGYYGLDLLGTDIAAISSERAKAAWVRLLQSITLRNVSSDSLAFVYENTLVTADTRRLFGTHSTPRPVAEYILSRIDLSRYAPETVRVAEPFAGAGIFLVAALRELRDQLPPDWSAERRHQFLVERMAGAELDVFACEVATLSLILADYPNANGWHVKSTDLFKEGALRDFLERATVILCNPPFEDFTLDERRDYPEAFAVSPSKAMVALHAAIDAKPDALGFVLPRGVLRQTKYRRLRERLSATYGRVELVSLPDRIFEKATYPCALVVATERRPTEDGKKPLRLEAISVADSARTKFLSEGAITSSRNAYRPAASGDLWIGELDALWSYLSDVPRLGEHGKISRGLQWRSQKAGVLGEPGPMRQRGLYKPSDSLAPFRLMNAVWLSSDPAISHRGGPLELPWERPKVLINNQRTSRGPWRLVAAADYSGLWASQQFTAVWPTGTYSANVLAAVLNGPLANAFVTEHSTDHDFTNVMIATLPLPSKLDLIMLEAAIHEYQAALDKKVERLLVIEDDTRQLNHLLLQIDALVLKGYDLPPRLERQLFDYFDSRKRPVLHEFEGWLPKELKGYVPLHEWLTRDQEANRGPWVSKVFKPAPASENEVLDRFLY
jgi:hypothetical protein